LYSISLNFLLPCARYLYYDKFYGHKWLYLSHDIYTNDQTIHRLENTDYWVQSVSEQLQGSIAQQVNGGKTC
jgi:hypothetical protein